MRRIVAVLLAFIMICGCAACASSETDEVFAYNGRMSLDVWMKNPDAPKSRISGSLDDIVRPLIGRGGSFTVYVRSKELLQMEGVSPDDVSHIRFMPDKDKFSKKYVACVSDRAPASDAGADGSLYVWVEKKKAEKTKKKRNQVHTRSIEAIEGEMPEVTPAPDENDEPLFPSASPDVRENEPTPTPVPTPNPDQPQITVNAENCLPDVWSNLPVTFTLGGIPDVGDAYRYALVTASGVTDLPEGVYAVNSDGVFSLAFAILDRSGAIVSQSLPYTLLLDFTPPTILSVEQDEIDDELLIVHAEDLLSGVSAFSVNAGKKWHAPTSINHFEHLSQSKKVFNKGDILVRDKAGNVAEYPKKFKLPSSYSPGGSGGKKKPTHAPSLGYSLTPYNALSLSLPDEPMERLVVGDKQLELSAEDDSGAIRAFHAVFTELEGETALTLTPEQTPGAKTCVWTFNGEVCRLLANSGVEYLAFYDGGNVTALPTSGFVAGTDYARLRGNGVPTRKFWFKLWQGSEPVGESDLVMQVQVDEGAGETYRLSPMSGADMYYQNVVTGDGALLNEG